MLFGTRLRARLAKLVLSFPFEVAFGALFLGRCAQNSHVVIAESHLNSFWIFVWYDDMNYVIYDMICYYVTQLMCFVEVSSFPTEPRQMRICANTCVMAFQSEYSGLKTGYEQGLPGFQLGGVLWRFWSTFLGQKTWHRAVTPGTSFFFGSKGYPWWVSWLAGRSWEIRRPEAEEAT